MTLLQELVRERRSVRRFESTPIDVGAIRELISGALWAPSPHNSQPWRFTLLSSGSARRVAEAMAEALEIEMRQNGGPEIEAQSRARRSIERITSAPSVLLCSLVPDGLKMNGSARENALEMQMAVQSVGSVLQTFFLLAHERGIGTCWMAAPMYCPDEVRAALGLPETSIPQALVLMGHARVNPLARPRRDVASVLDAR